MSVFDHLKSILSFREASGALEDIATLMLAARENPELKLEIEGLLSLPDTSRAALVHTAVEEMKMKGEPASVRAAFTLLSTPEGAAAAREALRSQPLSRAIARLELIPLNPLPFGRSSPNNSRDESRAF